MALSQITWPVDFPQRPQISGYKETPGRTVITSDFDAGPKRQRKRSSAAMRKISAVYYFKLRQKEVWDAFFEISLARSFWWPDPLKNGAYVYARFAEDPAITPKGTTWLSLQVELEIWPYITEADMDTSTGAETEETDTK